MLVHHERYLRTGSVHRRVGVVALERIEGGYPLVSAAPEDGRESRGFHLNRNRHNVLVIVVVPRLVVMISVNVRT